MNQIKITCPSCNETFSADEALRNHLKAKDEQHAKEIENNNPSRSAKMRFVTRNENDFFYPIDLKKKFIKYLDLEGQYV